MCFWETTALCILTKQALPFDRQGHGDRHFPFGSWKSGKYISVYFGRNAYKKIGMSPSRIIRIPLPHITITRQVRFDMFDSIIWMLDIVYRGILWNGAAKSESENIGGNKNFENAEHENIF